MRSLQLLQFFAEMVRRESFAAAARALGVTPSTVAKAVHRLEKSLQLRLFHRTTRRVTLTSDGERLLARCQRVIDELEFLEAEALGITDQPKGVLRLDLPIVFGRQMVCRSSRSSRTSTLACSPTCGSRMRSSTS
ncbi:MAG: LysR family transcriptional regulator [Variovorax sp.]|nr:MAG: LysR family transcriptional regulator [Variovorax sp.]